MSTPTDQVTLDLDALDAAAAKLNGKGADAAPAVVVDPELAAAADKPVLTPEDGLKKLQAQLEEEKSRRIAAETAAAEAANGEAAARTDVQKSQLDQLKSAIAQVSQANDVLEGQYADAMTAQDFKAAAKFQRQMGDNSAKLAQLEAGKTRLENAPKIAPRAPVDPVEALAVQLSPQSAAWVRAHPEFARDPQKYQQMIAAHQLAKARGHKEDTEGYFKSIEKTLDVSAPATTLPAHADDPDPADPSADTAQAASGGRQMTPAAAPVSRSGNGAGGGRPNVVKLTPEEVEAAHANFPDSKNPLEEYARNKLALKKEGKL